MSDKLRKTIEIVNEISPSFCAAKWYNSSIWLNNGRTASCHHPIAHSIPLDKLDTNFKHLHNTDIKKQARKEMLSGERPSECGYCWRVEDLNDSNIISDRAHKSMIYTENDIKTLKSLPWDSDIDPKTLEICFDNLCNLNCSYCNSEFSSTWSTDIKENGPYINMITPGGMTYTNDGSNSMPFGTKNENNVYVQKFFEWYHSSLRDNLTELRVSGGEPTRSPDFWRLVESFNNEKFQFAVNSNLIMDAIRLNKLIHVSRQFDKFKFHVYTSCESYGKQAEFVRRGLKYDVWRNNLFNLQVSNPFMVTHIMMTVSALSVWGISDFVGDIMKLREEANEKLGVAPRFHMSVNILRFPSFQSVNILPIEVKKQLADNIERVVEQGKYISEHEKSGFNRCVEYLRQVDTSYEDTDSLPNKLGDFKHFVEQYSERNKLSIQDNMQDSFNEWFSSL